MKKFIYSLFPAVMAFLLLQGCYKDLGNYEYQVINGIEISNFPPPETSNAISVMTGLITVEPTLRDSLGLITAENEDRYNYLWYTFGSKIDTMSTTRQLVDQPVGLPLGTHKIYYRVTEKSTSVFKDTSFYVRISTTISDGFLVLNDISGKTRVDMLSWYDNTFNHITDVVGSPLPDNPFKIVLNMNIIWPRLNLQRAAIHVLTKSGSVKLDPDLAYKADDPGYNATWDFVPGTAPSNFIADNLISYQTQSYNAMVSQGNLYIYGSMNTMLYRRWNFPANFRDKKQFTASSQCVTANGARYLIFDEDNKSLYSITTTGAACDALTFTNSPPLTPVTNMEKDLVFMGATQNMAAQGLTLTYYVLLKDASNDYWILRMLPGAGSAAWTQEYWHKIGSKGTGAKDIDKATVFATGGQYNHSLYYAVEGKVYKYNIPDDNWFEVLDKTPEKVTYMDFNNYNAAVTGDAYTLYKSITVATVNDAGRGSLAVYDIYSDDTKWTVRTHPTNDQPMEWTSANYNFGKIVSVCWKPNYAW